MSSIFLSPTKSQRTPQKSPSKSPHTPSKSNFNQSSSEMTIGELYGTPKKRHEDKTDYNFEIGKTKTEISILSAKSDAYAKNTTVTYRDVISPKANKEEPESYKKSPFGKKLMITDYSNLV